MGKTIKGGFTYDADVAYAPRFYVRENWADSWDPLPEARLISGQVAVGGHGEAQLQFRTEEGAIPEPWETTYATRAALNLRGWWVRMDLVGPQGLTTEFVGKVMSETREIGGAG